MIPELNRDPVLPNQSRIPEMRRKRKDIPAGLLLMLMDLVTYMQQRNVLSLCFQKHGVLVNEFLVALCFECGTDLDLLCKLIMNTDKRKIYTVLVTIITLTNTTVLYKYRMITFPSRKIDIAEFT